MRQVADLIRELCPSGVQHRALAEVGTITRGKRFVKSDMRDSGVPCIHYGEIYTKYGTTACRTFSFVDREHASRLRKARSGDVIIASAGESIEDIGKAVAWLGDDEVVIHDACYAFSSPLDPTYVSYFLQSSGFRDQIRRSISSSKVSSLSTQNLGKAKIPVPSMAIQRRIAKMLSGLERSMTKLDVDLRAEADFRLQQHAFYRIKALGSLSSAPMALIRDVVDFSNAKAHERLVDPTGTVALMTARFVSSGVANRFVRAEDVLTPAFVGDVALVMSDLPNGKALARTFYVDQDDRYAANQRVCLLRSRDPGLLMPLYLHYVMNRNPQLLAYDNGMDQTHLKKDYILDVSIPVPPVGEQERIVAILDAFEAHARDFAVALNSEIAARRQQYEYYRDGLLTFEEAA